MPKKRNSEGNRVVKLPDPTNPLAIPSVYANNMEVVFSGIDVRIAFNEVISDHGKITVERRAHIVTSFEHFRAIVSTLNDTAAKIAKRTSQTLIEASAKSE